MNGPRQWVRGLWPKVDMDAWSLVPAALMVALVCASAAAEPPRFNRDVRPILSNHCFACHGFDAHERKAGLRLDVREGATAVMKSGARAIVPGDAGASELMRRITSADAGERMPPVEIHKDLSAEQIEVLRRWIEEGAEYEAHWAYTPLGEVKKPAVGNEAWVANDVDRFVLAKLEARGIAPSPQADRVTLIRRVTLDLTGLPATAEEVDAFVKDQSADAWEKVVDRLLASPHYGERMAAYWLDLVRYADSVGYHGDQEVTVWPYRDYVIKAFNENMPFDRFTRENLAGDLLPESTREQKIASAYNRLGMMTAEGGSQPKDFLARYAADRVRTTSVAWLGSTMGCAECHDHKFDPFTAKDFYSFAAFFADIKEPGVYSGYMEGVWGESLALTTPEQEAELARIDREIMEAERALVTSTPELEAAQRAWEARLAQPTPWRALTATAIETKSGVEFKLLEDGSYLASGPNPGEEIYTFIAETDLPGITALRVELLPDDSLPSKGPGRAGNGNLVLNRIAIRANGQEVTLGSASATHSQAEYLIEHALVDNGQLGWAILPKAGERLAGVFETVGDVGDGGTMRLVITMAQTYGYQHTIGRFRISVTNAPRPVRADTDLADEIAAIVRTPYEERTREQRDKLAEYYRSIAPELGAVRNRLRDLREERKKVERSIRQMPITVATTPREMRVLPRGNWMDETGEVVQPAIPAFLGAVSRTDERLTRLDLANWLTSEDNPLTARVLANRVWYLQFGRGLSDRLDDVGSQGAAPTHPDLLDDLARGFVDSGWDVKALVKRIVMSNTYRQSSQPRPELRQSDPFNRLLARQNRYRLEAEAVRDHALAVSGLLVRTIGGRSVRPYQPKGYYAQLNFPAREYEVDTGDHLYRRGVYTHWQRTFLHPMLKAFDAPSREECAAQRARSNTPLAALTLLNDPTFVEAARIFARRIVTEAGDDPEARATWAYKQALGREPGDEVRAILVEVYREHRAQYEADPAAAMALVNVGASATPAELNVAELAAWTSVARVILNLHEGITRY